MSREAVVVRVQRALLRLLPSQVREEDGDEIVATFAAVWSDAGERGRRGRTLVRVSAGYVALIVLEWWDRLRSGRPSGSLARKESGVMDRVVRMIGYGARSLRRSRSFTWSVVLLLGLGVGSVTTIFTLVDHVLLRPLPYPSAERLFEVQNGSHSGPSFEDFQAFRSVEQWAATMPRPANLTGTGRPLRIRQVRVSTDFFSMFGARPVLGRLPVAEDFRTGAGVVLSAGLWERAYGADAGVIGRPVMIDGVPDVIIGVMDAGFAAPEVLVGRMVDVWRPLDPLSQELVTRDFHVLRVAGRHREDVALAAVEQEANALAERRAAAFPDQYTDRDGAIEPLPIVTLQDATTGGVREGLGLLLGAVALLLLVACTNVAQLFLARGLSRTREMAVRRALGARTRAITAQLVVESLMVGAGGALLGVLLANAGLRAFLAWSPATLPRSGGLSVDLRVLGFAVVVSATTALLFGLLPALRLAGGDVAGVLGNRSRGSTEGRRTNRARAVFVVVQVALSLILITQAGSLLRTFARLHDEPLGFRTEGVWTLPLTLAGIDEPEEWVRRMESLRGALAETPGVQLASYGLTMPLEYTGGGRCCWSGSATIAGDETQRRAFMHPVDADYFALVDLRFVTGVGWTRTTAVGEPGPAVISEPLAVMLFGSVAAALNRELQAGQVPLRVTGVVTDSRHYGPDQEHGAAVYMPVTKMPFAPSSVHMAVRVEAPDGGLITRLREAVWRVEPDLPVPTVRALADWAGAATARARFESIMFGTFGAVALLLVAGGLYGTLLYSVAQRRRELGIRLALGDAPGRVEGRFVSQGIRMAALGCLAGVAGAWSAGRLLQSQVFAAQSGDRPALIAAMVILLLVALLASWLPARRAAGTDPMEALRAD